MSFRFFRFKTWFSVFVAIAAVAYSQVNEPADKNRGDSILFSHATHLSLGAECESCHWSVRESQSADDNNLPGKEACSACHDTDDPEACSLCHIDTGQAQPFDNPERTIHFSHQLHLGISDLAGEIRAALGKRGLSSTQAAEIAQLIREDNDCTACHRRMPNTQLAGPENLPSMSDCLACHQAQGDAMNNCSVCHRGSDLLPESHQVSTFYDDHSAEDAQHNLIECRQCHTPGFNPCTQCH